MSLWLLLVVGCGREEPEPEIRIVEAACALPLTCPADLEVSCGGSQTAVSLGDAIGCPDIDVSSDAPSTYPLGETTVTFREAVHDASCQTTVTVTDPTAPLLQCPATLDLISLDGAPVAVPEGIVLTEDACSTAPPIAIPDTTEVPVGVTDVVFAATDDAGNAASCAVAITVKDGRPPRNLQVLSAALSADGTNVALGWDPSPSSDVDTVRVERAASPEGPWTPMNIAGAPMVDGLLVDGDRSWFRLVSLSAGQDGGTTAPVQAHAITAETYHLTEVPVDGIPFDTDLYGVVRAPADRNAGPYPLIVLLHGNHGNCRRIGTGSDTCVTLEGHACDFPGFEAAPNAEGMAFQAETLAAQGYIAVSISGNAVNCRSDYIFERSALILGHLRQWQTWSLPDNDWDGAVDLNRVGLIGHSRGGEAVAHVPALLAQSPIPGISVRSIFSIAPVDNHGAVVTDTPSLFVLPACDGDVSSLAGRDIYDRTTATPDNQLHAQAFMMGANHNFFSTEWAYNDGQRVCPAGTNLSARAQQGWLESTLGAWFNATLRETAPLRADITAEAETPESVTDWAASDLDVRWSYSAAERTLIDDFSAPDAPDVNLFGETNTYVDFETVGACRADTCGEDFTHDRNAVALTWSETPSPTATFGLGSLDASAAQALSMRITSPERAENTARTLHTITITVTDIHGNAATVTDEAFLVIPHLYDAINPRAILQTVRAPLDAFLEQEALLDLTALATLTIAANDGASGALLITDVEVSD